MSISNLVCVVLGGVLVAVFFLIRQTYRDRQKSSQSSQPGEKALQAQLNLMKSDLSDARNAVSRQALMAQRMALVAHVTAHAVLVTDASGLIEWVNDGFTRITGIKPEEALGRTPGALLQGAGTDQTTVATMRQAITEGAGFRVQVLNYTRLKIPIWVDVEAMPVYDDTGKVISFVAIQSDITVIKQAQSDLIRMRDLMNEIQTAASIGGWEHDCSTNLPFWTNETFRIFGLDAASGVPPIDVVFDFFIPDSREKIISAVADASGNGTPWNLELQVITLDKRRLWVRSIGQARHRQGVVTHLFGSFQDITSEHVIRHELTQAATKAQAADHAKSSFLAMVSHEIRTPMNGVIGMSELLGMTQLTEDQRVYLSTIVTSGELLLTIIDDILDFSRIEAGKLSIIPTSVDLHDLVANVLRLLQPAASDKRIYLVGLINPRVPHKVEIDGGRLRQIIINLLGNAIKFTKTGGVRITLNSNFLNDDRVSLTISVIDTGIGIPADVQGKLFQPFVQAEETVTTRVYGGTGLGLAICKRLTNLMGGTISLHSQPGVGSTFTVHLEAPVCHSDESRARMAVRYNTQPSSPTQQQLGSMALVVEDNLINQMLVVMLLKTMGYDRVTTAENGQQAIELAQTMRFDVILMDSQMPVMDGNVATHTIRQQLGPNRHTRIIAITANVQPEDEIAARSVGIDAFVTKPINADKLREALNCFPRAPKLPSEDVDADQKQ